MLWEQIKKVIPETNGPCVIVEQNKAKYVVMSYDEYEKLILRNKKPINLLSSRNNESEQVHEINQEIASIQEKDHMERLEKEFEDLSSEIQIEDLPFE